MSTEAGVSGSAAIPGKSARPGAILLVMPRFEDNRYLLRDCAKLLEQGETGAAYSRLRVGWQFCRRIPLEDYGRLSDFLHHAILAIETGEFEGSRYILLTAVAAFGWAGRI